ncbi:MAG TPA: hypothetical protein DDY49_02225 [Paenibacillaceae bacterium]|nr:hypothetical protein [Paenibacillaceae bacterium]
MVLKEFKYIFLLMVSILLVIFLYQYKWVINYYGEGPLAFELNYLLNTDRWVKGEIKGLDPQLVEKLEQLGQGIGERISITSGYRTLEEQQQLWDESDKSGKWVARPGESKHNMGLAVDVGNETIRAMTNDELAQYQLYNP